MPELHLVGVFGETVRQPCGIGEDCTGVALHADVVPARPDVRKQSAGLTRSRRLFGRS
jgi:hypothetical protein